MTTFGCSIYDGRIDTLERRVRELESVVDVFVVVEAAGTGGASSEQHSLRQHWSRMRPFALRLRHVVVTDVPSSTDPKAREAAIVAGIVRGMRDAARDDFILLSDADEIPYPAAVAAAKLSPQRMVRFEPAARRSPKTRKGASSKSQSVASVGFPFSALERTTPHALRTGIRDGSIDADRIANASPRRLVGRTTIRRLIDSARRVFRAERPAPRKAPEPPIIIIPYLADGDAARVRQAFDLDGPGGRHLPVFLWKDEATIGPERAYEYCWSLFPDRDVIILHTDMAPAPGDRRNRWYTKLREHAAALPDAGMIACNLLYPFKSEAGDWWVQCGGGFFQDGKIRYIGGGVDTKERVASDKAIPYEKNLRRVRLVDWVTLGGVYIRREAIDMVGTLDRRYEWAFVMDVDYSLEVSKRGLNLYQVPVRLLHEESSSTAPFLENPVYREKLHANHERFYEKWSAYLASYPNGEREVAALVG